MTEKKKKTKSLSSSFEKKVWYKENEVKVVLAPMGNLNQLEREKLRQTETQ